MTGYILQKGGGGEGGYGLISLAHLNTSHFSTAVKDRQAGVRHERKAALKKLKKYEKIEFVLNSTQHDDLSVPTTGQY